MAGNSQRMAANIPGMNEPVHHNGQCSCGAARFAVHGRPLLRAFCHCSICQAFNDAAYADITLFRVRDVVLPEKGQVEFRTYRPPPAARRGKCVDCGAPAIELLKLPLAGELAIIPSMNIADHAFVPEPALHIFYHRRVADIEDKLPKYSGYWRSQLAFSCRLLPALLYKGADKQRE